MKNCKNCGKELSSSQRHNTYCSVKCQHEWQYKDYISRWKNGLETGLSGSYSLSKHIIHYMKEKNNYKCEKCGWGEINNYTGNIPLEVHHIDGNHKNNQENNLQLLCPNCHSLTSNYKNGNGVGREDRKKFYLTNKCVDCGTDITAGATRCKSCQQKFVKAENLKHLPISREELKRRLRTESFEAVGRDYNISGNGLKKWCINYNLPHTRKEIKSYTDEEWEKI